MGGAGGRMVLVRVKSMAKIVGKEAARMADVVVGLAGVIAFGTGMLFSQFRIRNGFQNRLCVSCADIQN